MPPKKNLKTAVPPAEEGQLSDDTHQPEGDLLAQGYTEGQATPNQLQSAEATCMQALLARVSELEASLKRIEETPLHSTTRHSLGASNANDSNFTDAIKTIMEESQIQQKAIIDSLNTPKIELIKFDGDPFKYWPFIRSFDNLVDSKNCEDHVKLDILVQHCTGEVRDLLQCCLAKSIGGYSQARELLREHYGDYEVITNAWLDKILKRPKLKALKELRTFANDLVTCRETLDAMGYLSDLETRSNLRAIANKLPDSIYNRWAHRSYQIKENTGRPGNLSEMIRFIERVVKEANDTTYPTREISDTSEKPKRQPSVNASTVTQKPKDGNYKCPKCHSQHYLNQCSEFRGLNVAKRSEFVRSKHLCFNCFQPGHRADNCPRSWVCNIEGCGAKHNRWLHPVTSTRQPNQSTNQPARESSNQPVYEPTNQSPSNERTSQSTSHSSGSINHPTATISAASMSHEKVSLPIAPVLIRGSDGACKKVYALFDSGSTSSMCTDRIVSELNLPHETTTVHLSTVDRENTTVSCKLVDLQVEDLENKKSFKLRSVIARERLNIKPNSVLPNLKRWPHLADLDVPTADRQEVDLLIGQDNAQLLMPLEVRKGKVNEPFAVRTILGWIINGNLAASLKTTKSHSLNFVDTKLDQQVKRFWEIDDPTHICENEVSVADTKVIAEWETNLKIEEDHYSLPIPFKSRPPNLPNNITMAENRLSLLGKRLNRDNNLKKMYIASIENTVNKGHAEKVEDSRTKLEDYSVWYLPHHPVCNPHKPDKVRVVFDCAANFHGTSLNDIVYQGPDLTNKLIGVLLRFRQEPIAIMGDIEGMFNQVKVHETDRDVLRFLWWCDNDPSKPYEVYRMTTHLFGGVWSPSCANFALKRAAADNAEFYDAETVKTIERDFYVDDWLKSVATEQQATHLAHEVKSLLSTRGFNLTKFTSNSETVLNALPAATKPKSVCIEDEEYSPMSRALGVLWNREEDYFTFDSCSVHIDHASTKRGLLRTLSSVYDPLGFAAPFLLSAKMLFQEACRKKLEWDEKIYEELAVQWERWLQDLPIMSEFRVPRCIKPPSMHTVIAQLHHFSDASERGYGACTYLRTTDGNKQAHCALLIAKSKLAPLKVMTIPRLELSAAVLAVQLDKTIREHLDIALIDSVFWTDSTIVLQYIRSTEKRFQTFVANRVTKIRDHTEPSQWKHVNTEQNPADYVSRGMSAKELKDSALWLHGPEFLAKLEEHWPNQPDLERENDALEIKKTPQIYSSDADGNSPTDKLITSYSSWHRLKKAVAWILRLKSVLHHKEQIKRNKYLTVDELHHAETAIIKYVQQSEFSNESSKRLDKLSPTTRDGILRVGGRLKNAPLPEDAKHQIILPTKHHITRLIIRQCHFACAHGGIERTFAEVRQRFWTSRTMVKRVLSRCITCLRYKSPKQTQMMADLPESRTIPNEPPFTRVGVDYFGPFLVKRGRSDHKRYGCLFTCFATRAVHIEVAYSLDTDSFINALQRFVARRGQPAEITSDNGTNFVGAQKELAAVLSHWNQSQIHEHLLQQGIRWRFNPPSASHMGGVWERQIRSIRSLLLVLLKEQTLSEENLITLMCIIENIINSRPITKLSDDPNDPLPLTPNHLLKLQSSPVLPPGNFVKEDLYRRRWRQVQYLADLFWARWIKEYLPILQRRQKWLKAKENLSVGDLVLVADDNSPRYRWPLGLITAVYPGKDNLVRTVQVKTGSKLLERPITKMCLLEGTTENA